MKQFIYKTILWSLGVLLIIYILTDVLACYTDIFYGKFSSPKAVSMVLGDSRSFQGIQPEVVDSVISDNTYQKPLYNYSFTINQFSYDSLNYISVLRKHNQGTKNGLYILSVNPWLLSEPKEGMADYYKKNMNKVPFTISNPSVRPNVEYIWENFNNFNFKGIFVRSPLIHKSGWSESRHFPSNDELKANRSTQFNTFTDFSNKMVHSKEKLRYLEKMIAYFERHGTVVLVQLPTDKNINNLESKYWPSFDHTITDLANRLGVNFINYKTAADFYETYDGHHLTSSGGYKFSVNLAKRIHENSIHNKRY